jgi:hypothetical protein
LDFIWYDHSIPLVLFLFSNHVWIHGSGSGARAVCFPWTMDCASLLYILIGSACTCVLVSFFQYYWIFYVCRFKNCYEKIRWYQIMWFICSFIWSETTWWTITFTIKITFTFKITT